VESKLHSEVDAVLNGDREPSLDDLNEMHYLDLVIKETMRLYPSVSMQTTRITVEDEQLGDFFIPKGTNIEIWPWLIHRSPLLWENPLEFIPERHIPQQQQQQQQQQQDNKPSSQSSFHSSTTNRTNQLESSESRTDKPAAQSSFKYIPFGAGPRECIGKRLALFEAKVVICMVVQRFSLRVAEGHHVKPVLNVTLRPDDLIMNIARRWKKDTP